MEIQFHKKVENIFHRSFLAPWCSRKLCRHWIHLWERLPAKPAPLTRRSQRRKSCLRTTRRRKS